MAVRKEDVEFVFISLNKLKRSPRNARTMPHSKSHVEALANSIEAHGQLQNLVVETEVDEAGKATGFYLVTVGEGRRLAQLVRVKRKKIKADEPVRCIIDDAHAAQAVSLAENDVRANMHPADQFAAFKALVDSGQCIEEVAAQFSVTPLVVQRRLKLANVAPEFIEQYRKGAVTLDVLMALALTDDHTKQREVWKGLPKHSRYAEAIKRQLTESEIAISEPVVKFVGLKNYEKAGGLIRCDLFAEDNEDGFVMDAQLLNRLAMEKLDQYATELKAEGHAWVEVIPKLDYAEFHEYGRVQPTYRDATPEEQAQLAALESTQAQIAEQMEKMEDDEDQLARLDEQMEEYDDKIGALREQQRVPSAEQKAVAGAVVTINHDGKVRIERDMLKPDDAKRFARAAKAATRVAKANGPRIHSAPLVRRLTAHRTLALQATLAQRPDVALAALTHRLALSALFAYGESGESALQIRSTQTTLQQHVSDIDRSKASLALIEQGERVRVGLPDDPDEILPWLLKQSQPDVLALLAFCVALTIDGVQSQESPHPLDSLARAVGLNMADWWTPTAENYFAAVPKGRILDVVREAVSPEVAATLTSLKKGPLGKAAESRVAGKGWLPELLRTNE